MLPNSEATGGRDLTFPETSDLVMEGTSELHSPQGPAFIMRRVGIHTPACGPGPICEARTGYCDDLAPAEDLPDNVPDHRFDVTG